MSVITKEEEIQEKLLQAAKQLFQLHGFRRVTIDDIAKAIGKARSSLYYYYKTKEEILEAVVAAEIAELMSRIALAVNQSQTAEEKIKALFITKLQNVFEKRGFFNALDEGMDAVELSAYQQAKLTVHQQIMQKEGAVLSQIIINGIQNGELSALSQQDHDSLVFALLSSLHGLKREMVFNNDFSNVEPAVRVLVHYMINGLKN